MEDKKKKKKKLKGYRNINQGRQSVSNKFQGATLFENREQRSQWYGDCKVQYCNRPSLLLVDIVHFSPLRNTVNLTVLKGIY